MWVRVGMEQLKHLEFCCYGVVTSLEWDGLGFGKGKPCVRCF